MKNYILKACMFLLIALTCSVALAQEETTEEPKEKKKDKPVRDPFMSSMLIDNQTNVVTNTKRLELIIQHRMGKIGNGITDLYGIYGASNIRMALQYGVTEKIMVGVGTEKNNKLTDIYGKYNVLTQTRKNAMPIALTLFGNVAIDTRDEEVFGQEYAFADRMSYFVQAIVVRKFTQALTIQIAPSFSHFNSVTRDYQNDAAAVMIGGKYTIYNSISAIFEYHHPFQLNTVHDYQKEIQPGGSLGFEIATSTHAFQLFATNYQAMVPQSNYVMNTRGFDSEGISIGFNVNVKF